MEGHDVKVHVQARARGDCLIYADSEKHLGDRFLCIRLKIAF